MPTVVGWILKQTNLCPDGDDILSSVEAPSEVSQYLRVSGTLANWGEMVQKGLLEPSK